ncbi:hypothetical protein [Thermomonas flagellata]|uniref:hypothetical protein n=1 Tax=Thermomonas flagellata TaxID=2888524 RepID=UPI001F044CBB|nr:hypothetical protein [Thermomonas flagellata]
MHWLYLLLAALAMLFAFKTTSVALMVVALLLALVLFVLWAMALYASRMAGRERDPASMIDPAELRRLREQAEALKAAGRRLDKLDEPPSAP